MKYFIDTEFLEGTQKGWFGRNTKPTIDLISIGIVCEDGREYYAISKDFNLKEAWSRYNLAKDGFRDCGMTPNYKKVYWIRDNVLKPIYDDLERKEVNNYKGFVDPYYELELDFTYKNFKRLINKYGKSNKQIAKEIKDFVSHKHTNLVTNHLNFHSEVEWSFENRMNIIEKAYPQYLPEFYGYYADYDWVAFCWLFGKMIDLPKGFPWYCNDLNQTLNELADPNGSFRQSIPFLSLTGRARNNMSKKDWLECIKLHTNYPKQINEHNAMDDARWNFELYKFLTSL